MKRNKLFTLLFLITTACTSKQEQKEGPNPEITHQKKLQTPLEASPEVTVEQPKVKSAECGYNNSTADLGEGIVYVDSGNSSSDEAVVRIYNDSTLSDIYVAWHYYEEEPSRPACPKYFSPDYGMLHFVCLGKTEKSYKVLINYDQVKYLPRTKGYHFLAWEEYILSSYGINRPSPKHERSIPYQPIRVEPKEQSDSIKLPAGLELLCPDEIKGDWVKVRYDCFYAKSDLYEGQPCHDYIDKCKNPLTGWIKWKEGNEILIGIYLRP